MAAHVPGAELSAPVTLPLVPLVLLHGAGATGRVWQHQLLAFPRAVAPDLPGHPGGSALTSIAEMAAWVRRLLGERGQGPVVLGGHSLGSAVVLQTALEAPERLRGLILIGAGARLRVRREFFDLIRSDFGAAVDELLRWWFAPEASPRAVARAREALYALPPAALDADFRAADGFDLMDRVREIALPVLIVCGEADRMTPVKYAEYLRDQIAGSHLEIIPRAGHMVMLEQPRAVNEALTGFLRRFENP